MCTFSAPLKWLGWEAKYIWPTERRDRRGDIGRQSPWGLSPQACLLSSPSLTLFQTELNSKYDHNAFPRGKLFCHKSHFSHARCGFYVKLTGNRYMPCLAFMVYSKLYRKSRYCNYHHQDQVIWEEIGKGSEVGERVSPAFPFWGLVGNLGKTNLEAVGNILLLCW